MLLGFRVGLGFELKVCLGLLAEVSKRVRAVRVYFKP